MVLTHRRRFQQGSKRPAEGLLERSAPIHTKAAKQDGPYLYQNQSKEKGKVKEIMFLHPTLKTATQYDILQSIHSHELDKDLSKKSSLGLTKEVRNGRYINNEMYKPTRKQDEGYYYIKGKQGLLADAKGNLIKKKEIEKEDGTLKPAHQSSFHKDDRMKVYRIDEKDAKRLMKYTSILVLKWNFGKYAMILFNSDRQYIVNRKFFKQPK